MAATLSKPIIVPQYGTGFIDLFTPDPTTGAPTLASNFTVDATAILGTLFPGANRVAAPNAVTLHGNDLFFTISNAGTQALIELPNYLLNPASAISKALVVTLDGSDYVGLTFDAAGTLYTAEGSYLNNQIVKYTLPTTIPTGAQASKDNYLAKTVVGNAGATSYFGDMTFDASGNLWVADYQNSRVVAFDAATLGTTNTYHAITDAAGTLAVANTTTGLTGSTTALFSDPEGVAFDGTGASANLWVGNNNDGVAHAQIAFDSLVKITKPLQTLILATPANTAVSAASIKASTNVFIYNVPNNANNSKPQFGGVAIDTTAGVLYANEEVAGDARAYPLASIASTPLSPASTLLAVTTTNPGNGGLALVNTAIACFRAGTRLEAADGPVVVEALRAGMPLRTASGALRNIIWIGHSRVDCRRHPRPREVLPVRLAMGAIGDGLPERDLWLSPDHGLFIDGHLVPVRYLLNGATVEQPDAGHADAVQYFHVELETHDILLAEGLPAESYLDTGNRSAFANGGVVAMAAPDFARRVWEAAGCAPLCVDGPVLSAIRGRLLARAADFGFILRPEPGLRLEVDGRSIAPSRSGQTAVFHLPSGGRQVILHSRRFRPSDAVAEGGADHRSLGVAVLALRIDGAEVALDDSRLGTGWHASEPDLRWTDGAAAIDCAGGRVLEVTLAPLGRYWSDACRQDDSASGLIGGRRRTACAAGS